MLSYILRVLTFIFVCFFVGSPWGLLTSACIYPPPCPEARVGVFRGPASAASLVPWTLGLRVLKGAQGRLLASPCGLLASSKIYHFFDCFLTSLFTPSWTDFGANLAPFWHPKSVQDGPKSHPKFSLICILSLIPLWTDFLWILAPIWKPKPTKIHPKINPKASQQTNN